MDRSVGTAGVLVVETSREKLLMCLCEYMRVCYENKESDPPFLRGEGSYILNKDTGVEAELAGCCNCTIYTC